MHPTMMPSPTSSIVGAVPSPVMANRAIYDGSLPFGRSPSMDFEIEHVSTSSPGKPPRPSVRRGLSDYTSESVLQTSIARVIAAKARPFAVSGRIPIDPATLTLFFRTKSGITHSLDFPIDIDYDTPPALDVLMAACQQHEIPDEAYPTCESLFYPPNLPLTTSLEISNHPILEAIRNTLFPSLQGGHYLTAVRDVLEIVPKGGSMMPQPRPTDQRIATLIVSLPVRFRGGELIVRNFEGEEDRHQGRGGSRGYMEWIAFHADCDYEVTEVQKGCRVTISYAVHARTFGPSGMLPDPLITPSDYFLDQLAPIFNLTRGRWLGWYLTGEYSVNPADVLAESLVPYLKGGDSLLYHAIKLYKLAPELRWAAGRYIWPVDCTVQCGPEIDGSPYSGASGSRRSTHRTSRPRSTYGGYGDGLDEAEEEVDILRHRVEDSGAIPLVEADITLMTDKVLAGKERVPLVVHGALDMLVVNILLAVYVP